MRQDINDEIESQSDGFPPNFSNHDRNSQTAAQRYHRRYTGYGFTSQGHTRLQMWRSRPQSACLSKSVA